MSPLLRVLRSLVFFLPSSLPFLAQVIGSMKHWVSLPPLPENATQRAANRETAERARAAKAERRKTKDRQIRRRLEAQKAGLDPSDVVDTDEEGSDGGSADHSDDDVDATEASSPDVGAGSSSGQVGASGSQVVDPSVAGPDVAIRPLP